LPSPLLCHPLYPCRQQLPHPPSTGWAAEFEKQQQASGPPASWAEEFTHGEGEKWAGEFQAAAADATSALDARAADPAEAMAATRRMVEVLSADSDPKMRSSQFLQFLSKMSRGELLIEESGIKQVDPAAAAAVRQWAEEFDAAQAARAAGGPGGGTWADDFLTQQQRTAGALPRQVQRGGDWVDEFARGVADLDLGAGADAAAQEDLDAAWAAVGAGAVPLNSAADWVREFGGDDAAGAPEEWDALYQRAAVDAAAGFGPLQGRLREYVFTDPNPFLGDDAALAKGKDL
jgi:peroxin-5